ncbi:hypothetical protein BGZ67_004217 [Mortierella alpina]|nr:hypothetical protein BGZ67_004217 [Mortierella alpina]
MATARVFHYDAIATGALFLGRDTSNPRATRQEVYSDPKNHATATASISVYAANSVSFDPSDQSTSDSAYSEFKRKVSTFPGFVLTFESSSDLTFDGNGELVEKVAKLYNNYVEGGEGAKVGATLGNVVGDHLENDPSKNWAFTTVVIHQIEEGTVQFELVELSVRNDYVSFESVHHRQGEHDADLTVSIYKVNNSLLVANAQTLADKIPKVSVGDYITFFTSAASFKGSLEAWLEVEQNQNSEHQTTFTRRPHGLYPRM